MSGSSNGGGGTASGVWTAARLDQDGRCKFGGCALILTVRGGNTTVMSAFAPDPDSEGLLVLNGVNHLQDGR